MAFKRTLEMRVGVGDSAVIISGLDVSFNINRTITPSENTAEFVVYNASESTRRDILKEGNNIIFSAGYVDEDSSVIFIGNIDKAISYREEADWVTEIESKAIRSKSQSLDNVNVSLSFSENTGYDVILQQVTNALGLSLFGGQNVSDIKIPSNFVYVGDARAALKNISSKLREFGKSVYIDNGEAIVYNTGQQSEEFTVQYLTYDSGLLSVSDITEYEAEKDRGNKKRVGFECIMMSSLQPNSLITIKNTDNDGVYIVESLNFYGDNFGGDFNVSGEASE